jgi:hypothetical protein
MHIGPKKLGPEDSPHRRPTVISVAGMRAAFFIVKNR